MRCRFEVLLLILLLPLLASAPGADAADVVADEAAFALPGLRDTIGTPSSKGFRARTSWKRDCRTAGLSFRFGGIAAETAAAKRPP